MDMIFKIISREWLSYTIHGIMGFTDRYDYENLKKQSLIHWTYGIPGSIQDYLVHDDGPYGNQYVFNTYHNDVRCKRINNNNKMKNNHNNNNNNDTEIFIVPIP